MKRSNGTPEISVDPSPYLRAGGATIVALALGFFAWASLATLDGAVLAPGKVAVEGSRKTVQATSSGVVSQLLAKEGQDVEAGQVLIRIDHTVTNAARESARARLDGLLAKQARLEAEWSGAAEIRFADELISRSQDAALARVIAGERAYFEARREAHAAEAAAREARIPRHEATRRGHRARAQASRVEAESSAADLESARQLFEKGYIAASRLRSAERDHARATGQVALSLAAAESARQEIEEVRLEALRTRKERSAEVARDLEQTREEIVAAREAFVGADQKLRYTAVRAPAKGRVFGLAIHTEGGVVREGDRLLQIVPDEAPLVVEARIPVHEVDRISHGQAARVQLSAFDSATLPPVSGIVESISADRFEDANRRTSFYVARIRIDEDVLRDLPEIELRPGMPAETWISTGDRSALSYLMKPLTDGWSRALLDG